MPLNIEDKKSIIEYRVEKSAMTMIEARDNAKLGHWNLVANRLYYSMFYMIAALLLDKDIQFKSHAGAIRTIGLHFVTKGLLTPEDGSLLSHLQSMRSSGDYDDLFDWTEEKIAPMFEPTQALLDKMKQMITQK